MFSPRIIEFFNDSTHSNSSLDEQITQINKKKFVHSWQKKIKFFVTY